MRIAIVRPFLPRCCSMMVPWKIVACQPHAPFDPVWIAMACVIFHFVFIHGGCHSWRTKSQSPNGTACAANTAIDISHSWRERYINVYSIDDMFCSALGTANFWRTLIVVWIGNWRRIINSHLDIVATIFQRMCICLCSIWHTQWHTRDRFWALQNVNFMHSRENP